MLIKHFIYLFPIKICQPWCSSKRLSDSEIYLRSSPCFLVYYNMNQETYQFYCYCRNDISLVA